MKLLKRAVSCILVSAFIAPLSHASAIWTVTMEGIVGNGFDHAGLFGAPGALSGSHFVQSITIDTSAALYEEAFKVDQSNYRTGTGPRFTGTVTLNGKTVSFASSAASDSIQLLNNSYSVYGGRNLDIIQSSVWGATSSGDQLRLSNIAFGSAALVPSTDFTSSFVRDVGTLNGYRTADFLFKGQATGAWFYSSRVDQLRVNIAEVPEPLPAALIVIGLAGLALTSSRKAHKARKEGAPALA